MCGIVGVVSFAPAIGDLHDAAYKLLHRSHKSAGAVTYDVKDRSFHCERGVGNFLEIFTKERLHELRGSIGMMHLRWATEGELTVANAHPLRGMHGGSFFLAHNGEISYREALEEHFRHYQPEVTTDTKFIAGLIEGSPQKNFEDALQDALRVIKGTYSLLVLHGNILYAGCDVTRNRPLYVGRRAGDHMVCVASESSVYPIVGISSGDVREVHAGELLVIHGDDLSIESKAIAAPDDIPRMPKICSIELMYAMYPTTIVYGRTVKKIREALGRALAKIYHPDADMVVGVPDSGLIAAAAFAEALGIPLVQALMRYHYTGRIFYYGQKEREELYRIKYDAVEEEWRGRRGVLVDDTIFAGDTARKVAGVCVAAGAKELHVGIPAPMIVRSCFYGTPTASEHRRLIARDCGGDCEHIRGELNAACGGKLASLAFLPLPDAMCAFVGTKPFFPGYEHITTEHFCNACFLGGKRHIPVDVDRE